MIKKNTNKTKKPKNIKYEEEEEEESEGEDEYQADDFLIPDNEMEEEIDQYNPRLMDPNRELPEAVIESDLGSSDLDIMEDTGRTKKKKLRRGGKDQKQTEAERTKIPSAARVKKYSDEEDEEEMNQFIDDEDASVEKEYKVRRKVKRSSVPHNIFTIKEDQVESQLEQKEKTKENIYSKDILEEEYATQKDKRIKILDVPERLIRIYGEEALASISKDIDIEAEWILEKLKTQISNLEGVSSVKKKIAQILEHNKKDFLDVPYIATYRHKNFEPEINASEIWKIFEYDREWIRFTDHKQNVRRQFTSIVKYLDSKRVDFMERRYIENAKTIRELRDMESFISFIKEFNLDDLNNQELQEENHTLQRPIKKSVLRDIKQAKIHEFARKFSLSSHDFAINLELILNGESRSRLIAPLEPRDEPSHLAFKYIDFLFDQEIKVMTNACRFLALEMFHHPFIRNYAWNYFRSNCTLSTEPTEEGKKELDVFHPSYRVKRLVRKPVESFTNDLFLDILQNESKNFITVRIDCIEDLRDISERINSAYNSETNYSSTISDTASKWKIMREEAIRMLVVEFLFPEFKKEIRKELQERAENFVINQCANYFYNLLFTGPYRKQKGPSSEHDIFKDDNVPRVMSFVYDNTKNELYCVMVNQNGEVLDHHIFNYLANRPSKNIRHEEKQSFYDDIQKCKDLIQQYKPDLIVIGANDLKCKYLKDQINTCLPDVKSNDDNSSVWITFGDLTVPNIYASSPIANKNFPNYTFFHHQAVSLARFKQNPLEEILQLWHYDVNKNNCLSIPLHPLQKMVNQTKLVESLEMEAVKVTNNVGLDINKAFEFDHLRSTISFISGLGPRKASHLLEKLIPTGGLQMRIQLIINHIFGKKVFMNTSGFLRIRTNPELHYQAGERKYDLLDMTRIHPEFYPMANKLAKSALDDDDLKDPDIDHVEIILREPKKLNVLEISDYVKKSEEKVNINIGPVIEFIIAEFFHPFKDPRPAHRDLSPSELFYLLVGDENIRVGQITLARVVKVDSQHVKCRLTNDLEATVWIRDIFEEEQLDKMREQEMKEKYKEGMIFEARIKSINENSFKLDLATKPSLLISHKHSMQVNHLDKYFQITEEDLINRNYQEEIKSEQKKYVPRNIKHPLFRNVTFIQAVESLRNAEIGECIFRPSSKGINNLTLTWKFYRHIYAHVDIQEEDKLPGASIGSRLRILNETYSGINEIVERYVNPCAKTVKEVAASRKFCYYDSMEDLEKRLKEDKARDPTIINYLLTILPDYPQNIIIGYSTKLNSVTKEFIRVKPRGLYFHDEYFPTIDELINFFKKNYGTESYRDHVKKSRPPALEERRKKEEPNEYASMEYHNNMETDMYDNRVSLNASNGAFNQSYRSSSPRRTNERTCHNCNQPGHFAKECPSKREGTRSNYRPRDEGSFVGSKRGRSPGRETSDSFKDRRHNEGTWGNQERSNPNDTWGESSRNKTSSSWGNDLGEADYNIRSSAKENTRKDDYRGSSSRYDNVETKKDWGSVDNSNKGWGNGNTSWNAPSIPANSTSIGGWDSQANNNINNYSKSTYEQPVSGTNDLWSSNTKSQDRQNWNQPNTESQGWNNQPMKAESNWAESSHNNNTTSHKGEDKSMTEYQTWGSGQTNTNTWGADTSGNTNHQASSWGNTDQPVASNWGSSSAIGETSTSNWGNSSSIGETTSWKAESGQGGNTRNWSGGKPDSFSRRDNSRDFNDNKRSFNRDNNNNKKSCYNCGEEGHFSNSCDKPKKERERRGPPKCFNCGEEGHMSGQCDKPKRERRGGQTCYNCNEEGHMSSQCPKPKKERRGGQTCYNCNEEGHRANQCEKPRAARGGRGGSRGGRGGYNRSEFKSPEGNRYNNNKWSSPIEEKDSGSSWNNSSENLQTDSGWGPPTVSNSGWGSTSNEPGQSSGWGSSSNEASNWGSAGNNKVESSGWGDNSNNREGSTNKQNESSGWGGSTNDQVLSTGWGASSDNNSGQSKHNQENKNEIKSESSNPWGETKTEGGWGNQGNTGW